MSEKELLTEFANWMLNSGYKKSEEENLWSAFDLPFLFTTEEVVKEFLNRDKLI